MDRAHLIDELGDQFDLHQRSVAADGDGALSRSERAHMATYPGKLGLRKICAVHGGANRKKGGVSTIL